MDFIFILFRDVNNARNLSDKPGADNLFGDISSGNTLSVGYFVRRHIVRWLLRPAALCPLVNSPGHSGVTLFKTLNKPIVLILIILNCSPKSVLSK